MYHGNCRIHQSCRFWWPLFDSNFRTVNLIFGWNQLYQKIFTSFGNQMSKKFCNYLFSFSFAWCDVIKMKKSCYIFRLPKSISLSSIFQYQRCSPVTLKNCQSIHNLYVKKLKSTFVVVIKYNFNLDGLILLFGFFKSDTEIGYAGCLLTNIWGVSSLFKRKNICKIFSKPFTLLGTLRAFNAQYL